MDLCAGQLRLYSSIAETAIDWLWYPYIPFGKITLVQGDPGCGKSTLMMNIISAVPNGSFAPDGRRLKKPMHAIYQCSEDGAGDTIKQTENSYIRFKKGRNCQKRGHLDTFSGMQVTIQKGKNGPQACCLWAIFNGIMMT